MVKAFDGRGALAPRHRWRLGFGQLAWRPEDGAYAALLETLTQERQRMLLLQHDLAAPACTLRHDDVDAQMEHGARAEVALFRAALEDARARSRAEGQRAVTYDSRDPQQDRWAEVLIQYLVCTGYAEVATEEAEPWHYRYTLRIDWDRLRRLVTPEGLGLPL